MATIPIIQPKNMSTDFRYDATTKKYHISDTASDAILEGQKKYRLIANPTAGTMEFYEYTGDSYQGTNPLDEIPMSVYQATVDDTIINNGVLTFVDKGDPDNPKTLTFDPNSPLYSILKANSNSARISGDGKDTALQVDVVVDAADNMLKLTTTGLRVDPADVASYMNTIMSISSVGNTLTFNSDTHQSSAAIVNSIDLSVTSQKDKLAVSVNGVASELPLTELQGLDGTPLGYIITP